MSPSAPLQPGALYFPADSVVRTELLPRAGAQPPSIPGSRIEAFNTCSCPFVVPSGHAVERRIELFRVGINAPVGLLQRTGRYDDAEVDVDDLTKTQRQPCDLLGSLDVTLSKFEMWNQTF